MFWDTKCIQYREREREREGERERETLRERERDPTKYNALTPDTNQCSVTKREEGTSSVMSGDLDGVVASVRHIHLLHVQSPRLHVLHASGKRGHDQKVAARQDGDHLLRAARVQPLDVLNAFVDSFGNIPGEQETSACACVDRFTVFELVGPLKRSQPWKNEKTCSRLR